MKRFVHGLCCAMSLSAAACGSGNDDVAGPEMLGPTTTPREEQGAVVNGTLLARVDVTKNHRLEFYAFAHGQAGVFETGPIEEGKPLLEAISGPTSLAEIYRMVLGASAEVPQALVEADAKAKAAEIYMPLDVEPRTPIVQETPIARDEMVPKACAPDFYNDNYGAQWFFTNLCNVGNFRLCDDNWPAVRFLSVSSSFLNWRIMAADFVLGARMHGGHYAPVNRKPVFFPDFDFPVFARNYGEFVYSGSGRRDVFGAANADCPRIHWAIGSSSPLPQPLRF